MKIVGVTGTFGSGKSLVRNLLKEHFDSYHIALSTVLKRRLGRGVERKSLQDFGNEMRMKFGHHILAEIASESLPEKELIIIDGIRNPGETEFLRKKFGNDFKLVGIDAPIQLRFERIARRKYEKIKNFRQFLELDERDKGKNEPEWGQQVAKCLEQADYLIINDGTIEDLRKKVEHVIKELKGQ
ncbi:MAG: AAA family ATPase [Candidatus Aenigmarchaeota archaeon]|nr:AAA family ATPase [Candidatus Aenigmarchaeota archaeon]